MGFLQVANAGECNVDPFAVLDRERSRLTFPRAICGLKDQRTEVLNSGETIAEMAIRLIPFQHLRSSLPEDCRLARVPLRPPIPCVSARPIQ